MKVFAPGPRHARGTADRLGRCLSRLRDVEHGGHALVFVRSGTILRAAVVANVFTKREADFAEVCSDFLVGDLGGHEVAARWKLVVVAILPGWRPEMATRRWRPEMATCNLSKLLGLRFGWRPRELPSRG